MTRLVTFTTEDGADVTVQVPDDAGPATGPVTRGWGSASSEERTDRKLDDALAKVQPAVLALLGKLRSLADSPDEIEVQFGVQMSVEVGAFITASSASNFHVTMKWKSPAAGQG